MILYLHGFRSSPRSFKAQLLGGRLAALGYAERWRCPRLPASPLAAVTLTESIINEVNSTQRARDLVLIGSSLGGYYATWLAERHGCRAVLLNPAINPKRDLHRYLGKQPLGHGGDSIVVTLAHLDELAALQVPSITDAERYYLLAATGDEVLDYREMLAKYPGAPTTLIDGGDHALSDFTRYADSVLAFCGIKAS